MSIGFNVLACFPQYGQAMPGAHLYTKAMTLSHKDQSGRMSRAIASKNLAPPTVPGTTQTQPVQEIGSRKRTSAI